MKLTSFACALLVVVASAIGQTTKPVAAGAYKLKPDTPQSVVAYFEQIGEARKQRIDELNRIISAERDRIKQLEKDGKRAEANEIRKRVQKFQVEISEIRKQTVYPPPIATFGNFDTADSIRDKFIRLPQSKVFQVIDDKNAIVQLLLEYVVDNKVQRNTILVWVEGVDTSKWVDGQHFPDCPPLLFDKARTYESASGGPAKLLCGHPINPADYLVDPTPTKDK